MRLYTVYTFRPNEEMVVTDPLPFKEAWVVAQRAVRSGAEIEISSVKAG